MTSPLRCGAIASHGGHSDRCGRNATQGLAFCWQHGRNSQQLVADLETYGPDDPEFLLQRLTLRENHIEESFFNIEANTPIPPALKCLNGDRGGINLGYLEGIPLEILWLIFSNLSIPDLTNFKATNTRAHRAVSTSAQYYCINTYAPQLIAALYNRRLSSVFPVGRVYNALTQAECTACGRFAGYILLPGLQRCCQRCAAYDKEFWPVTLEAAIAKHGIPNELIAKLPKMLERRKHTPMYYEDTWWFPLGDDVYYSSGSDESDYGGLQRMTKRIPDDYYTLVSKAEARKLGTKNHTYRYRASPPRWLNRAFMPLPCLIIGSTLQESTLERGLQCLGCVRALCDRRRELYTNYCTGCQISRPGGVDVPRGDPLELDDDNILTCKAIIDRGRLYPKAEILNHISECGNAQAYLADLHLERNRFS